MKIQTLVSTISKRMNPGHIFSLLLAVVILLALVGVQPTYAAGNITVNSLADDTTAGDTFCTLREAINNANTDSDTTSGDCAAGSGADTIVFSVSGTITLGSTLPTVTSTMIINGPGADQLTVDGGGSYRVLNIGSVADLTLDNLTIANGNTNNSAGGINNNGTLTLTNSTLSGNSATGGINSNTLGGGIYNNSIMTIANTTLSGNSAAYGGGILNHGTLTVSNSTLSENLATDGYYGGNGGGIYNYQGTLTVTGSTFTGNISSFGGGGIANSNGTITVTNSTFTANIVSFGSGVGDGGGIFNGSGTTTVTNSTFAGNTADHDGSGVFAKDGTINLNNSLIADNTGSGNLCSFSNSSSINAQNTLIEDNLNCVNGTNVNNLTGGPLLGALADNGGATQTMALLDGSPAIDAGDDTLCPTADQRGVTRPQGIHCDVGAFEVEQVNNTAPVAEPGGPYLGAINTNVQFDGSASSDPETDALTYAWDFGDSASGTGAMPTHSYSAAGVYTVCLTVNDGALDSDPVCTMAVVYDPSAGFVTGGGWINSPAGAYIPDPSLTGKASFGFVSKYKQGASVPTGNTAFAFDLAGLDFQSDSYEWLVVNQGGANAQFKGSGTVNDGLDPNGNPYKFMLWAGDDSPDTFRIKIWWEDGSGEHVVYDNGSNQPIGGGNIVVHKGK